MRVVFARPGYRRLWVARTASLCGDIFATVALSLLVFDLTGSALGVSGVIVAEILPVLLLAPLAGSLVDRLPRISVMVAADLVRAVLAGALVFLSDHVIAVYLLAFGLSAGAVLFNPAANSALPTLVDDEQLIAANSGIWTAAVLSQIALAPVAASSTRRRWSGTGVRHQRRQLPRQRRRPCPAAPARPGCLHQQAGLVHRCDSRRPAHHH
jgi:MFS family permease